MRIAVPDFVSSTMVPLIAAKALEIFKRKNVEIVLFNGLGAVKALRDSAVDFSAGPAHAPMMIERPAGRQGSYGSAEALSDLWNAPGFHRYRSCGLDDAVPVLFV